MNELINRCIGFG